MLQSGLLTNGDFPQLTVDYKSQIKKKNYGKLIQASWRPGAILELMEGEITKWRSRGAIGKIEVMLLLLSRNDNDYTA
jgi:hypothetical protein